jgi:CheY-like chemotaxis protein
MKSILIIDDCQEYRETTANILLDAGYDVWEATCPKEAFEILHRESFNLIVCDLHMPFATDESKNDFVESYEVGVRTVRELRDVFPDIPVIALSNTSQADLKRIAKFMESVPTYSKPIYTQEYLDLVGMHIENPSATLLQ